MQVQNAKIVTINSRQETIYRQPIKPQLNFKGITQELSGALTDEIIRKGGKKERFLLNLLKSLVELASHNKEIHLTGKKTEMGEITLMFEDASPQKREFKEKIAYRNVSDAMRDLLAQITSVNELESYTSLTTRLPLSSEEKTEIKRTIDAFSV